MARATVELLPRDIDLSGFNSRREKPSEREPSGSVESSLTDEQLDLSVKQQGVLQPPMVRRLPDGVWSAVFGFRRIAAASRATPKTLLTCLVFESTGNDATDEQRAKIANLTENLHREDLKPWEIAEALYALTTDDDSLSQKKLATMTGLTVSYVGNLLRLRTKAHPEVWRQFQKWGTSMRISYNEVLQIVTLPKEQQLEQWNAKVTAKRRHGGQRGKEKKPGPVKLAHAHKLADSLKHYTPEFRKGLKLGLAIALGLEPIATITREPKKRRGKHGKE